MFRIFISIFLAVFLVGVVLWTPWQAVNADNQFLQAASVNFSRSDAHLRELRVREVVTAARSSRQTSRDFVSGSEPLTIKTGDLEVEEKMLEEEIPQEEILVTEEVVTESNYLDSESPTEPALVETETVTHAPATDFADDNADPETVVVEKVETIEPAEDYTELTTALLENINAERERKGLPALLTDDELANLATGHSDDMAENVYLGHEDSDDCDFTCRIEDSGYRAKAWAENVLYIENADSLTTKELARRMVASWMSSGGHRQNILNNKYTRIGAGFAYTGDTIYATTDFALPR